MKPTDDELMQKIAQGDKVAFEVLFQRHSSHLLGFATTFLNAKDKAEDITQEVWVKVVKLASGYNGDGRFVAWIYTMTRNHCLNYLRGQKRFVFSDNDDIYKNEISESSLESELLNQADLNRVNIEMGRLPESQRVALMLFVVEDLSYEEIATEMDLSLSAVKSLIFRARSQLIAKLENGEP